MFKRSLNAGQKRESYLYVGMDLHKKTHTAVLGCHGDGPLDTPMRKGTSAEAPFFPNLISPYGDIRPSAALNKTRAMQRSRADVGQRLLSKVLLPTPAGHGTRAAGTPRNAAEGGGIHFRRPQIKSSGSPARPDARGFGSLHNR